MISIRSSSLQVQAVAVQIRMSGKRAGIMLREGGKELPLDESIGQFRQALFTKVAHSQKIIPTHCQHLTHLGDVASLQAVLGPNR
jgi:hypothetical protein